MGREYRLSRNSRLREKGHRRQARVSDALRVSFRRVDLDPNAVIAGIDVGETYLDIATFSSSSRCLNLARIDLRRIGTAAERNPHCSVSTDAITLLRSALVESVPELRGAIVLIDSPRWPSGFNSSNPMLTAMNARHSGREIDTALRDLVLSLRSSNAVAALPPLSLFPTPTMAYFGAHLNLATCKPHLRSLGQALFGNALNRDYGPASGGIFTRFMIAGFATYRALYGVATRVYESYPELQFGLWDSHQQLLSKNSPCGVAAARESRIAILSGLAERLQIKQPLHIRRMDEADAAILALSTAAACRHNTTFVVQNCREGSFLLGLDPSYAEKLPLNWLGALEPCSMRPAL